MPSTATVTTRVFALFDASMPLPRSIWAISQPPDTPGDIEALALPDHRLAYLDYEGPVSRNRGAVTRYDRGEFAFLEETAERIQISLRGDKLRGILTLLRDGELPEFWIARWKCE